MFNVDISNARSITIPDGVVEIGPATFAGCTKLASIVIPDGVESIERFAFDGCIGLTDIYVNQSENSLLANASVPEGCTIHWNSAGPDR